MPDLFGKLKSGANKVAFEADKLARVNRAQGESEKLKARSSANTRNWGKSSTRSSLSRKRSIPPW